MKEPQKAYGHIAVNAVTMMGAVGLVLGGVAPYGMIPASFPHFMMTGQLF